MKYIWYVCHFETSPLFIPDKMAGLTIPVCQWFTFLMITTTPATLDTYWLQSKLLLLTASPPPSPAISHLIAGNHFRLSLSVRTSNIISTSLHEIQLNSWISSQKLPQKRSKKKSLNKLYFFIKENAEHLSKRLS